jgi:glycosyltransferase involved in cell wall biosynthesis
MELAVITSLFPSPPRPREGIFAEERCRALAARGHRLTVIQPVPHAPPGLVRGPRADFRRMPDREARGPLAVHRPRYWHWPGAALGNAQRFARAALRRLDRALPRPRAVLLDYAWPAAVAAAGLGQRGLPVLIGGRGSDILAVAEDARLRPLLAMALAGADVRLAVSTDLCQRMDALAGTAGTRLLANGVDRSRFFPGDRALARQRLGLDPRAPLVLVVGHLIPRKDPLRALEAFVRGAPEGARLVFLGRGELEPELRRAIALGGLGPRVELFAETPPGVLGDWYRAADLLLLTSRREGRPNVVIEALACATPVLATAVGGTPELLAKLPECLAADGPAEEIGARLAMLLREPPAAERLLRAAAGFSWERCAGELEELIEAAIASASSRGARP